MNKLLLWVSASLLMIAPVVAIEDAAKEAPTVVQEEKTADEALAKAVKSAFEQNKDLEPISKDIQVTAEKGAIILRGTVDSETLKDQFGETAKGVSLVTDVINNIEVAK
jgi:osmotically-inducible protein OsmY